MGVNCKLCNKVLKNQKGLNIHILKKHCDAENMNKNSNLDLESKINDIRSFFTNTVNALGEALSSEIENFRAEIINLKDEISQKLAPSPSQTPSIPINAQPESFPHPTPQPLLADTPIFEFPRHYVKNTRITANSNPIDLRNSFSALHIEPTATKSWGPNICNISPEKPSKINDPPSSSNNQHNSAITISPKSQTNRASYPFVNRHPENDRALRTLRTVPGNEQYADVVANNIPQHQPLFQHQSVASSHHQRDFPSQHQTDPSQRGPSQNQRGPSQNQRCPSQHQRGPTQHQSAKHQRGSYHRQKIVLLGDSNLHGIHEGDMARHVDGRVFIKKMAYSGATASHLLHYADIALEENPHSMIIHGGTNDLYGRNKNNKSAEEIAHELINIGGKARNKGVENIYISSILPIADNDAYNKGLDVNFYLKEGCLANNFIYICNSFLTLDDLKDTVHLSDNGRVHLVNNYIDHLNRY